MNLHIYLPVILFSMLVAGCSVPQQTPAVSPTRIITTEATVEDIPTPTISPTTPDKANPSSPTPSKPIPSQTQTRDIKPRITASTPSPTPTETVIWPVSPTPRPTLAPGDWKKLPIIPEVSDTVIEIYFRGLELGNNPIAYSKIGDCGSTPAWFLGDFDRGVDYYSLGEYQYLDAVIEEFKGSHDRTSLAARSGFNASSLLVTLWSDIDQCESNEHPLECEYRIHRPIIAIINLGANDIWQPEEFEPQMRKIIEFFIDNGVIPIISTKADNQEGDWSINETIARLAFEYDIPLWNYWLAVQPLRDHGLQEDGVHLTWGGNHFDNPYTMTKAWPYRNLTALQVLDAVWRTVTGQGESPEINNELN
jgi:hypothetical protein